MTDEISTIAPLRSDADQRVELAVSVIIPHYNDLQNLERCIGLLAAQTLPRDQYEVVVADNNSRCGIDAVRRVCGKIARVVPAPIQGAGPARNAAVAASRGKVLAFIDSDCRPSSSWLERGLAALSSAQIVGGRVDVDYVDPSRPTAEEAFERVFAFNFKRYIREVGFSGSGNMFVPREIFDNVGGFRAQVAEDVDWGQRALIANYRFAYADDVVVSHPARRSWTELTQKWGKATREAYASAIEKPNGRLKWALRSVAVLASPFVHWTTIAQTPKLDSLDQRLMAIGVLFRIRFWRFIESNRLLLKG
ncbi:glycosyltransferase [Roseiarcus sp.]|uniref:glycosyltransferase n=1 Tax=Roseiarcus sp. TaxID=1969460 RepID=UPI003F97444A